MTSSGISLQLGSKGENDFSCQQYRNINGQALFLVDVVMALSQVFPILIRAAQSFKYFEFNTHLYAASTSESMSAPPGVPKQPFIKRLSWPNLAQRQCLHRNQLPSQDGRVARPKALKTCVSVSALNQVINNKKTIYHQKSNLPFIKTTQRIKKHHFEIKKKIQSNLNQATADRFFLRSVSLTKSSEMRRRIENGHLTKKGQDHIL